MTLVVDANVVIKWFVDENLRDQARHIFEYQLELTAPEFVLAEVANIAWKKARRNEIDKDQARFIVESLPKYIPFLIPTRDLIEAATRLALNLDHPVYDCIYLACAQGFGSGVTADRKFFERVEKSAYAGLLKFIDDPDLQLPLHIPVYRVNEIIKLSKLIEETHRNLIDSLKGESEFSIVHTSELQPLFDSPAFRRLAPEIEDLSAVEQADILALGWLGQGYSGDDWQPLREDAETRIKHSDKRYLVYVESLSVYLEQGLARLRSLP